MITLPPFLARPRKWLTSVLSFRRTMRSPDRLMLVRQILPAFAERGGSMLWIGVRRYTRAYPAMLERRGGVCWTTDIDARWACFGRASRHVIGDVLQIDQAFAPQSFQTVLLNGVFGFGIDDPAAQTRALEAIARVMAPGGLLLIGWNTDRTADPLRLAALAHWFEPTELDVLPARQRIEGTTHVYDLVRRRPA